MQNNKTLHTAYMPGQSLSKARRNIRRGVPKIWEETGKEKLEKLQMLCPGEYGQGAGIWQIINFLIKIPRVENERSIKSVKKAPPQRKNLNNTMILYKRNKRTFQKYVLTTFIYKVNVSPVKLLAVLKYFLSPLASLLFWTTKSLLEDWLCNYNKLIMKSAMPYNICSTCRNRSDHWLVKNPLTFMVKFDFNRVGN